jgi:hypothetical protein
MNLKRLATAILSTFLCAAGVAFACDCIDSGPFLIAARDAPVIIRGRVSYHLQHGLALEVHEVYRGSESRSTIRIWGDNGRLCRRYADQFSDGSEWVFALHQLEDEFLLAGEAVGDFQVSSCGEYAVRVVDGHVITFDEYDRERQVSLGELGERLRPWGPLR